MTRIRFKDTVLRESTILRQANYLPSEQHPAPIIVQFQKEIATGVLCKIWFQLLRYAGPLYGPERDFKIVLLRTRLPNFPLGESRYADLNITLSNLMWFKYKIEVGPTGRYWEFTNTESLRGQLIRAQGYLRDYAIEWFEDPLSQDLWVIPAADRDAFRTVLTTIVAIELEPYGYRPQSVVGFDLPIFVKPLPNGLNALVEFKQVHILNPSRFEISVGIHRKRGNDPYEDQFVNYPGRISNELAMFMHFNFGVGLSIVTDPDNFSQTEIDSSVGDQDSSSEIQYWQYTEEYGLQRCIADILDKLKRYALPWLEDLNSRNIWPAKNKR